MDCQKIIETLGDLKEKPGVKFWIIQDNNKGGYKLSLQTLGKFGSFFSGNCYVLVQTLKPDSKPRRDIYLWIGSQVLQEEANNIFKSTHEATNNLEGTSFHRECEANESGNFLDFFQCGVRYFKGSAQSYQHFRGGGYVKRLFHVKGRRNVQVAEVPMSYKVMNKGDSFVLDDEWTIYCWNGKQSNKAERIKAIEVARGIRDELCYGKAEIVVADEGCDLKEERRFFVALGNRGPIQSPEKGGDDDEFEQGMDVKLNIQKAVRKLFKIRSEDDEYLMDHTTFGHLKKYHLDSTTSYLLDAGDAKLYVWIGRKSSQMDFVSKVMKYIDAHAPSAITSSITFTREGFESGHFKQFFDEWPETLLHQHKQLLEMDEEENEDKAKIENETEQQDMIDDAEGPVKIWLIEGCTKVLWPLSWYGYFYNNECYVIDYISGKTKQHILYIWQGKESYTEEQKASLGIAQQLDEQLDYQATLIKLLEGKENEHFLKIFKGQMVVLKDDDANRHEPKCYRITGDKKYNVKTTQITPDSINLCSEEIFLLRLEKRNFLWEGKFTSEEEHDLAEQIADKIAPKGDLVIFREGQETPEFWKGLGGKEAYHKGVDEQKLKVEGQMETRLFHCSDATGRMKIEEISPFDQKDMNGDDVMILDAYDEVFIWFGEGSNIEEKRTGWDTAKDFITISGRKPDDTTISQEKQGFETPAFKSYFANWDPEVALDKISYDALKKQITAENKQAKARNTTKPSNQKKTRLVGERELKRTQFTNHFKSYSINS